MPSSDLPEVFAAQVLLWILLPVALFAPTRWAVLAWLVMGNLDATGPGQSPAATVGWLNAIKSIVLPLFLCWRLRKTPSQFLQTLPARLWLALCVYAAIASLWSPFPLAAAKLVGNIIGISLTLVVLEKASRLGLLDAKTLIPLILASLALGVIQTYYYGGGSYGFDGFDQPSRFSSFIAAQQYAAFLVCFLAVLLWQPGLNLASRAGLLSAVGVALVLNGSRVWFVGAMLVVLIYSWFAFRRVLGLATLGFTTLALGVMFAMSFSRIDGIEVTDSSNRIFATASALVTGVDTSNSVGLRDISFRGKIYNGVFQDLRDSGTMQILLGHGTSSGGSAAARVFPNLYKLDQLDPNRVIHNEWLRALYEWGVAGCILLIACLATALGGLVARVNQAEWKRNAPLALAFFPAFLASFSGENILAGAGNAVTMSLALILALLWSPQKSWRTTERRQRNFPTRSHA